MSQQIIPFVYQNRPVRTITDKRSQPWLAAVDVCGALGIVNLRDALSRLEGGQKTTFTISAGLIDQCVSDNNPGTPLDLVSETGVYALILVGRKQGAGAFRRWVRGTVFPAIRGGNGPADKAERIPVTATRIGDKSVPAVLARDLHVFLGVGKEFGAWIRGRIQQYHFREHYDFIRLGSFPFQEYRLTLDMAKYLSVAERVARGMQARQYFLECEQRASTGVVVESDTAGPGPKEVPCVEQGVSPEQSLSLSAQLLDEETIQTVNARNLHAFLGIGKDFSTWIKDRIGFHGFVENQDFVIDSPILGNQSGRGGDRRSKEYHLTVDAAKHISMAELTPKGREAREYLETLPQLEPDQKECPQMEQDISVAQALSLSPQTLGDGTVETVNARNLHDFLGVGKKFADWIKDRIEFHGFVENQDFVCFPNLGSKDQPAGRGGHNRLDYHLTVDAAKHVAMAERTSKGKEARDYFIECERRLHAIPGTPRDQVERLRLPNLLYGFPKGTTMPRLIREERILVGQGVHDFGLAPESARKRAIALMADRYGSSPDFLFRGLPVIVPERRP